MSTVETSLAPLDFKPGINKDLTSYASKGYYVSCDNIRFRKGKPQKIGGRVKEIVTQASIPSVTTFTGVPRASHTWTDLKGQKYLAIGTHQKLELFLGGKIYDITPIESSVAVTNALTTQAGSSHIIVSVPSHTVGTSSFVDIRQQTSSIGNILLDGTYEVVSIISPNAYIISVPVSATITSTGGGSVHVKTLLEAGQADNGFAFGWGAGTWGTPGVSVSAGWSDPRGVGAFVPLRQWSLDNYGQDLLANPRGGAIYHWEASAGPTKRAQIIPTAPSVNNFIIVAQPAHHVMSFGATNFAGTYDPLTVRWSDSEDFTQWTPAITNESGEIRLTGGNTIIGAVQTSREIMAITEAPAHRIKYLGNDYVFGSDEVGGDCGLVAPHGGIDINGNVFWMSYNSFFMYNGSSTSKLDSTLDKAVFDTDEPTCLNFDQKEKVFTGHNAQFGEIIWFYPTQTSIENNRYVIFNYMEGTWYDGNIVRTTWEDIDVFERPYATDSDGVLWVHESGKNDGSNTLPAFIESSEVDMETGDVIMFLDKFIPDFNIPDNQSLTVSLYSKKYPNEPWIQKDYIINNQTRFNNIRLRGRRFKVRYSVDGLGSDFEVGMPTLSMKPDGKR